LGTDFVMGISGLLPFLKNACGPTHMRQFSGSTAAIDVYCFLHKGAFGCAEQLVQGRPTDAYIKYVMKYVNMLLYHNIKPILVFDGRNLPSKAETERKRRKNRKENREKAIQLLSQGKNGEAREFFQRCVDITPQMAREVIQACRARNVDCIVAPYEADAQLAYLNRSGLADLVITEDSDLTLFGCTKIIFKINDAGDGVLYEKERLGDVFANQAMHFDFDKFRNMCIMSGCDYLSNLPGIGLGKSKQFWSKITNPNIRAVLPKIPHYLKLATVIVTSDYIEKFVQARNTFLYQLVFDPISKKERPLEDYVDVEKDELDYCGQYSDETTAYQLALGNLDLHSLAPVTYPDTGQMGPPGSSAKYGTVAPHKSIWSPGYTKASSHSPPDGTSSTTMTPAARAKLNQTAIHAAFGKPAVKKSTTTTRQKAPPSFFSAPTATKRKLNDDDIEKLLYSPVASERKVSSSEPSPLPDKRTRLSIIERDKKISSMLDDDCSKKDDFASRRILGDAKLELENTTVSKYFGDSQLTKEEVQAIKTLNSRRNNTEADKFGQWFDKLEHANPSQDQFVYRAEKQDKAVWNPNSSERCTTSAAPLSSKVAASCLGDISNSPPKRKTQVINLDLKAFERQRMRNPFAVKKPIFNSQSANPEKSADPKQTTLNEVQDLDREVVKPYAQEDETPYGDINDTATNSNHHSVISSNSPTEKLPSLRTVSTTCVLSATKSTSPTTSNVFSIKSNTTTTSISTSAPLKVAPTSSTSHTQQASQKSSLLRTGSSVRVSGLSRKASGKKTDGLKQPTLLSMFALNGKKANI